MVLIGVHFLYRSCNLEVIPQKSLSGGNLQACNVIFDDTPQLRLKNGIRLAGAGSVLQHIVAQDGRTSPQLFRGAITSSTFLPSQYMFNDYVPEVSV